MMCGFCAVQEPVSSEVFNVLREENGRLRDTVTELERVAKVRAIVYIVTTGHDITGCSRFKCAIGMAVSE
jgi:hypothetical protein